VQSNSANRGLDRSFLEQVEALAKKRDACFGASLNPEDYPLRTIDSPSADELSKNNRLLCSNAVGGLGRGIRWVWVILYQKSLA
jgi:hypothetical protein